MKPRCWTLVLEYPQADLPEFKLVENPHILFDFRYGYLLNFFCKCPDYITGTLVSASKEIIRYTDFYLLNYTWNDMPLPYAAQND